MATGHTKVYESPATPLRIPKITIKNNFRNELPPKNKESASDLNTPSLKIKLLRTYDGEWTTSDKKKKRREKDKKIKPVMISLLKSPDKGRRSPCLIIRKENLIEKENKSNIKIKIKKTPHNNTPQLKRLKIKELPHRDDLNAEDRENTCETPLAVVTSQPPAPKPVEELLKILLSLQLRKQTLRRKEVCSTQSNFYPKLRKLHLNMWWQILCRIHLFKIQP